MLSFLLALALAGDFLPQHSDLDGTSHDAEPISVESVNIVTIEVYFNGVFYYPTWNENTDRYEVQDGISFEVWAYQIPDHGTIWIWVMKDDAGVEIDWGQMA